MKVRVGRPEDAPQFVRLRDQLRMPNGSQAPRGGFLLGSEESEYLARIADDIVFTLEMDGGEVGGFAIVTRDATVRQSEIWRKKDLVDWQGMQANALEQFKVCYFDQLAVVPHAGARSHGKTLAMKALALAMQEHDLAFATVVEAPVRNLASRPFLAAAGFQAVGRIDEHYQGVGAIISDVFVLTKPDFMAQMEGKYRSIYENVMKS